MPIRAPLFFMLSLSLFCTVFCYGPDIGEKIGGTPTQGTAASPGASVPTPQIYLPIAGYRTSSQVIRFQGDDNALVDGTDVEIYQGATQLLASSLTTGIALLTLPGGTIGSLTIRARNKKLGVYSDYSASVNFSVEDFASASVLYTKAYNTVTPGCGDGAEPFGARFVFCNADPHWNAQCANVLGGGGNVWTCDTGDYLGTNVSGSGLYSANSAIFNGYNAPDGSVTGTGYLQNASGTDDGLAISCREKNDGANNHYAMWIYPNRNPATTDNVTIVRHYPDNSNITLASGRFAAMQNKGAGAANSVTLRFDCIGTHLTAYYQSAGNFTPLLSAADTSWAHDVAASYFALGVGPGGVVTRHTRMTTLEIRKYP